MAENRQCCYSVFEGLLPPPHNTAVLNLIFHLAHWHGLAKLRLHSDLSLDLLDAETTRLGEQLRHFKDKVCPVFETRELKREADHRKRKAAKQQSSMPIATAQGPEPAATLPEPAVSAAGSRKRKVAKQKSSLSMVTAQGLEPTPIQPELPVPEAGSGKQKAGKQNSPMSTATAQCLEPTTAQPESTTPEAGQLGATISDERAWKTFSLDTYKAHSLGDYVEAIKRYGTTDSFSTETVSEVVLYSQIIVY